MKKDKLNPQSSLLNYLQNRQKKTQQLALYVQQSQPQKKTHNYNHSVSIQNKSKITQQKQRSLSKHSKADVGHKLLKQNHLASQQKKKTANKAIDVDLPSTTEGENWNVRFYLNQIKSKPNGDYIDNIHSKWWKDYTLLQSHHGYIQWVFPNSFASRFNQHSYALTSFQTDKFIHTQQIAEKYARSYDMMLQFYGIKVKNKVTGQLVRCRNPDFRQRFHKTLLTSFHNHMRITRILCSLVMTGFGRYAKQLALFLKFQIQEGGLKMLKKFNVYKDWGIYQECKDTDENRSILLKKYDQKSKYKVVRDKDPEIDE